MMFAEKVGFWGRRLTQSPQVGHSAAFVGREGTYTKPERLSVPNRTIGSIFRRYGAALGYPREGHPPDGKQTLKICFAASMTTTIGGPPAPELPCAGWLDLFDPVPILQTKPGMIVLPVISTGSNVKAE
jgi:hypothetical protein